MSDVHFKSLDLNLLRVFDALYAERSATLAGARLGLTQSAISHALGRLRQVLKDELFVRGPTSLLPTPRGAELGPAVREAMALLEDSVGSPAFDPLRSERQFVIGATAYTCSVLLPGVMRRFAEQAPHARLRVRGENLSAEELDRGRLDMILGAFDDLPPRFAFTPLMDETGVWVIREGHPALAGGRNIAALAGLSQVLIAPDDVFSPPGRADSRLKRQNRWRELSGGTTGEERLIVPDTYSALAMVRQTDMVCVLPRRLTDTGAIGGLVTIEPERPIPPVTLGAVTRAGEQGPVAWLLGLMGEAAAAL